MLATTSSALRVGIFGASGTTGTELVSLVAAHPRCTLAFATSRAHAGQSLRAVEPGAVDVPLRAPDEPELDGIDVAFVCLPHGSAAELSRRVHEHGVRVVDLSGDLRLRDEATHGRVYGTPRDEALVESSTYGLTELSRGRVPQAPVVSNPGCYPTCATLALAPLARLGVLEGPVVINALSGVSGAGRQATAASHFCAVADDVRPYALGRRHRHTAEIEQNLAGLMPAGSTMPPLVFCPHVIPIERGMLVTATVPCPELTPAEVVDIYAQAYEGEPFVEVLPLDEPARIRAVTRTNHAVIGLHPVSGPVRHLVVTCAIDNLLKGAAGQAVQNMNLMFGLSEIDGLPARRGVGLA